MWIYPVKSLPLWNNIKKLKIYWLSVKVNLSFWSLFYISHVTNQYCYSHQKCSWISHYHSHSPPTPTPQPFTSASLDTIEICLTYKHSSTTGECLFLWYIIFNFCWKMAAKYVTPLLPGLSNMFPVFQIAQLSSASTNQHLDMQAGCCQTMEYWHIIGLSICLINPLNPKLYLK
jgi:hypothetical protein